MSSGSKKFSALSKRNGILPFENLPRQASFRMRLAPVTPDTSSLSSQPDLLDWQPPQTHLSALDVDAKLLDAVELRRASGETFLYALVSLTDAHHLLENGLPLEDRMIFLEPDVALTALTDVSLDQEVVCLRVRRRLIQCWLERHHDGLQSCYVLTAKRPSRG